MVSIKCRMVMSPVIQFGFVLSTLGSEIGWQPHRPMSDLLHSKTRYDVRGL